MTRRIWTAPHILGALLFPLALLLISPAGVNACDFEAPPPPERAIDEATAVFAGEVVAIEPVEDDPTGAYLAVTFDVDQAWKGVETSPVTVETHRDEATCGYPFEEGERYLVYAHGSFAELTTALFHRTTEWERADEDLNALGEADEVAEAGEDDRAVEDDDETNLVVIFTTLMLLSVIVAVVIVVRRARAAAADEDNEE